MRRCRAGDEDGVRLLMRRYNQRLFRIARSILKNDIDAEDAVQDAYLKAFGHLGQFRGDASVGTWLTRILMNEAIARARRRAAWVLTDDWPATASRAAELSTTMPDPEVTMHHTELRALVEASIDRLPDPFRLVFVARFVQGMSVEETAEAFGLRPETVKTRAHRARARLRADLQDRLGASVGDAFSFDGARCDRLTDRVLRHMRSSREPGESSHI